MIDVKGTIFKTLNISFDRMRMLGENNKKLLKKIMYLIVLDDIYDWSDYLDEKQSVQKKLQELRTNFIMCNPEFEICRFPFDQHYVNVNTPQTNYTWKRVWDSPELELIEENIQPELPSHDPEPWEPDETCEIQVVYFDGEGAPTIDVSTLTTCEKMNLYINRETGTLYYLDTNGEWQEVNQGLTPEDVIDLIKEHRGKINRNWTNSAIELSIVDNEDPAESNLELLTTEDLEEMI